MFRFGILAPLALLIGVISCGVPQISLAAAKTAAAVGAEYDNLPVSSAQLRLDIRKANLIAHGKIVGYEPPTVHDHVGTLEKTTITLMDVYSGTLQTGATLNYVCVCHHEESPKPADMIGHEVLAFLTYDIHNNSWSPASSEATFYYHDGLRDRIQRMLRGAR